jgi:hypothetical protein
MAGIEFDARQMLDISSGELRVAEPCLDDLRRDVICFVAHPLFIRSKHLLWTGGKGAYWSPRDPRTYAGRLSRPSTDSSTPLPNSDCRACTRSSHIHLIYSNFHQHLSIKHTTSHRKLTMAPKQVIFTDKAPAPLAGIYNQAIVANGTVYCSGSIGMDPKTGKLIEGDIAARTVSLHET